ncbi:hypothetical protein [Paenibacillus apiarius]|uniref:Uncharacterized protein n=1 Tax=Paenibacillus apiarius TaxID=46240 RepID=A0ABT4DVG8_9BACL|nr:hypothetical protein [Paenibacillus apiarius]MCY9513289.1 hypothetical protein [Paenibacillus apiarius]MCY9521352.1 hypothetical protein [Paenibacillus apiarius]MCY9555579.1 hypothetical protein [Paenibacillus apiarius]MCY9560705.1 hypothetical protein [Paenibacillus apiarius]MCY9685044.1 hypothetical protein [Paenibacillus apiarius]
MNKRLTDEERSEWGSILMLLHASCEDTDVTVDGDNLCALIESERDGWEEVERLKWDIRGLKYRQEVHKDLANQIHKQLQDALNTLDTIVDYGDGCAVDMAMAAIQRIQEGMKA